MKTGPIIGIVGGMGPYAGLDLVRKILDETMAKSDQDHLPLILVSLPSNVPDRTPFVLGTSRDNPAQPIAQVILQLEKSGASVVGMPCNTAHAPVILDVVLSILMEQGSGVRFVHMIEETIAFLQRHHPVIRTVGLLATTGTVRSGVYQKSLSAFGIDVLVPPEVEQEHVVHRAIYDPHYGIKAQANPVTERARQLLLEALHRLVDRGAEAIVLGCTELPLAIHESKVGRAVLIDPARVLARALIRATYPERLKPFGSS